MRNISLLIMAAGIGSRYQGGIKQLEPIDDAGHIIMDYSLYDAIQAGFSKIIFVIRRDIEDEFRSVIGDRIERACERNGVKVCYAFQELSSIPEQAVFPKGRTKPWGTGQAVLAAREYLTGPFAVINADDFYGARAYQLVHDWLAEDRPANEMCMAGFVLKNTLSENGGVTRGICKTRDGFLTCITETKAIEKRNGGVFTGDVELDPDTCVSMNMWGFQPSFLPVLECGWRSFFETSVPADPLKAEFLLPIFIGNLLAAKEVKVQVLSSPDVWFGMTYREDTENVKRQITEMLSAGRYAF